jgi:LysM repeat protein
MTLQAKLLSSGSRNGLGADPLADASLAIDGGKGTPAGGTSALNRLLSSPGALARLGPGANVHEVRKGETLSEIAAANGTSWQRLAEINGIANPNLLQVGQQIRLPSGAPATYTVRPGDTLHGIAAAHSTTVATLAARNGIADRDRIHPGQQLTLAGGNAATQARQGQSERVAAPVDTVAATSGAGRTGGLPQPGTASIKAADLAEHRAAGRSSIGRCYAWVKTALQQSGAVADYLPGVAAKGAGPALEQRGFVNILNRPGANIRSPYDAPKGAVLVYGAAPGAVDRNAKYGHIEIRTASGFASDYASANARTGGAANGLTGRGRTLIGVYVKPDVQPQAASPSTGAQVPGGAQGAYAPANLSLGANDRYRGAILEASTRTGMAPQTVAAIIDAEAAKSQGVWQANSRAGTSSATGLTQFLSGTWIGEATRAGSVLNQEAKAAGLVGADNRVLDRAGLLAARNDPRLSILAGADYARHNVDALRDSGHVPADASPAAVAKYAYMAHHEGLAGARGLIDGDMAYLRDGTFEANVPSRQRAAYLDAAGGNEGAAYRGWISDYVDRNIDVTRFMGDARAVEVPAVRSLYR